MAYIYLITNKINDKKYVGYTNQTPQKRFIQHKSSAKTGRSNMPISKAIRKYGADNFEISTLEESKNKKHLHETREAYWIKKYDTQKIGYNVLPGGGGICGLEYTKEIRKKMRESHLGQKAWNKGKKLSKQHIDNLKISHYGNIPANAGTGVTNVRGITYDPKRKRWSVELHYQKKRYRFGRYDNFENAKKTSKLACELINTYKDKIDVLNHIMEKLIDEERTKNSSRKRRFKEGGSRQNDKHTNTDKK